MILYYNNLIIKIFLFFFIFYFFTSFIFIVKAGTVAVITTFGKVTGDSKKAGLHIIIPFAQRYHIFSIKTQVIPEEFSTLTKDLQVIKATATIKYAIKSDQVGRIFAQIAKSDQDIYPKIIKPSLLKALKSVFSKYDLVLIASEWGKISEEIEDSVSQELQKYNYVNVIGLDMTGLVIAEEYRSAIEEKQIAEQRLLRAQIEVKIAEQEAIKFKTLSKNLDNKVLYKLFLDKWNGKTAVVPGLNDNNKIPIIVNSENKP
jgi:prohibitin 2